MEKHIPKSPSDRVLNNGVGGLSGQIAQTQPSPLLAQGASLIPSSQLAQTEVLNTSTHLGDPQSSNGKKPVLTESSGSITPILTLVGTLNWAVRMLAHRKLVKVEEVKGENGVLEGYVIRLPSINWVLTSENLLALKENKE